MIKNYRKPDNEFDSIKSITIKTCRTCKDTGLIGPRKTIPCPDCSDDDEY